MRLNPGDVNVRKMTLSDLDSIVEIDEKVFGKKRPEYYQRKVEYALDSGNIVTSLVAEVDGIIEGFIMGNVFLGEFGIPEDTATIDTIGVDPDFQRQGIARTLVDNFVSNMRAVGVSRIHTLVEWNDGKLIMFFDALGFAPARTLSLELRMLH